MNCLCSMREECEVCARPERKPIYAARRRYWAAIQAALQYVADRAAFFRGIGRSKALNDEVQAALDELNKVEPNGAWRYGWP